MKMLTVSLFVCAMMALTRAAALPETNDEPGTEETTVESQTDGDIWTAVIPAVAEDGEFPHWFPSCPDGWTMFSTRCVLYVPEKMTWAEAEQSCQSKGDMGSLASVSNAEQSDEIHEVMQSAGHENGEIWVGGSNTQEDPSWSWSDFMASSEFYDWCSGETDNRKHHCLQITFGVNASGCLDDTQCDTQLPSVCSIILM